MIKFDSYSEQYKKPFGAVRSGDKITFNVKVNKALKTDHINLVIRKDKSQTFKLEKTSTEGEYYMFSGTAVISDIGLYSYRFELVDKDGIMVFAGTEDAHTAKTGDWLPEWKLFIFDKNFHTSTIPADAIMYQIFPDRFYKAEGVKTKNVKNQRIIHQDWNERPHCFFDYKGFKCNDFFMGNLRGIEQKIPYLKSLGVTHLYLNPIFESAENHRYATSDYLNIDPYLGSTDDFKSLCDALHENDIKIIIDGVFSHTGDDSIYFNRYGHYGKGGAFNDESSPYREWYTFKEDGNYECWWGFKTLPNVTETNKQYLEFITGKDGVLTHWQKLGADGYRLDVADELPDQFLEKLRKRVKENNNDALIIGEVWENAVTKESYGAHRKFLEGAQCDSVMNYPFLNAIIDFITTCDSDEFYKTVMEIVDMYPAPAIECLMNSLSTHDTARILNRLSGAEIPEKKYHADTLLTNEQRDVATSRLMMAAALQYTLPGMPCIYYGDEAGLEGFSDPSCRRTYPWGKENNILLNLHKKLGIIRHSYVNEFSKPIKFECHINGVLQYRRGKLRIIANMSNQPISHNGSAVFSFNTHDKVIDHGGIVIEEVTE